MDETGNFAGCKKLGDPVFKGSNLAHGDIHIDQLFVGQIHCFPPSFLKLTKQFHKIPTIPVRWAIPPFFLYGIPFFFVPL
jgi:hypothetical protein